MDYNQEELFDAYLDQVLAEKERVDFEAALVVNEQLRDDFNLHRSTRELIQIAGLKAALSRIQQSVTAEASQAVMQTAATPAEGKSGRTKPFYTSRMWQAAAAVVLITAGIATWRIMGASATDKLYAKYYAPDAGLPGLMGSTDTYSLDDAMVDYKSGQYGDAVKKLEVLRQQGIAVDTASYYLGMAYLADRQYKAAMEQLHPLTQKENVFRSRASWYEALALLKSGHKAGAKALLEMIAKDTSGTRAASAQKLLAEWPE